MIARLSRPFSIRRLHRPEEVSIEASEEERAALAQALDIVAVKSLTATFTVRPWRGEGVAVSGTVCGEVVQECVVTLQPVDGRVEETVDMRLHPTVAEASTVDVDPEAGDPPELLDSDSVDLGAIAVEHFALGLDPYPKAEGVTFEADVPEEDDAPPSPFAVLSTLRTSD
ncbi:MAG: DUF177 domain-containing protein [Pseudomonadota bacterium]